MNITPQKPTPAKQRLRWTSLGIKVGWVSGTALGSGLATWPLLLEMPHEHLPLWAIASYCLYPLMNILGWAVFGGFVGFQVGLVLGALLDFARKR
jgi:hypothetical protein